jgi:DNA-binding CsgD family transcriptional regulator
MRLSTFEPHDHEILRSKQKTWRAFSESGNRKVTMDVKLTQRTVIEFLLREGCARDEIATRLQNVYGEDAYYCASVFRSIQETRRGNEELRNEGRPGRPCRREVDAAIRSILQDEPSDSLRTIAETLVISPETVRTHMTRIGSTLKALR